jgi:hypothetical protein
VFTARYAESYIKQLLFVFKGLTICGIQYKIPFIEPRGPAVELTQSSFSGLRGNFPRG